MREAGRHSRLSFIGIGATRACYASVVASTANPGGPLAVGVKALPDVRGCAGSGWAYRSSDSRRRQPVATVTGDARSSGRTVLIVVHAADGDLVAFVRRAGERHVHAEVAFASLARDPEQSSHRPFACHGPEGPDPHNRLRAVGRLERLPDEQAAVDREMLLRERHVNRANG
jgi:hypothetical protein